MADGLNRCFFMGNLGADAELKDFRDGGAVLTFRVGCTETYLDRNQQRQESTEWIPCVLFGKRASGVAPFMTKGQRVMVEGKFSTSSYEKDGQKRYSTQVKVSNVILCGSKSAGGGSGGSRRGGGSTDSGGRTSNEYNDTDYGGGDDSDIPFIVSEFGPRERWHRK